MDRIPPLLVEAAEATTTSLLRSPVPSVELMWLLRPYLARALAESTTAHGVFLDVLGMGVLIKGESGVGKSELALELISRGSGLVARITSYNVCYTKLLRYSRRPPEHYRATLNR